MKTKHMKVKGQMVDAISYEELTAKIDAIFASGNVVSVGYTNEFGEDEEMFGSPADMALELKKQIGRKPWD